MRNSLRLATPFCLIGVIWCMSPSRSTAPRKDNQPVVALVKGLKSANPKERIRAAIALSQLGEKAAPAAGALAEALADEEEEVRENAVDSLVQIGRPAVLFLIKRSIQAKNRAPRVLAIQALERIGPVADEATATLVKLLADTDVEIRRQCLPAIAAIKGDRSVSLLLRVLKGDPEKSVQGEAIRALASLGPKAESAVPVLITIMKRELQGGSDPDLLGYDVAIALTCIGPTAIPALLPILKDKRESGIMRQTALYSITKMGGKATAAVPEVINLLGDKNESLRWRAADAIRSIGPSARSAVPALEKALTDPSSIVRVQAAAALYRVDPSNSSVIPTLKGALKDKEESIRRSACFELGEIGAGASSAISQLIKCLQDPKPNVRMASATALGKMGPAAIAAVPALVDATHDTNAAVRSAAAQAVRDIAERR